MTSIISLQQRLTDAYGLQAMHYEVALRIVNEDAQALELDGWAYDLQTALQQVEAVEVSIAQDKLMWERSAQQPGSELRGVLQRVGAQIRALATAIDRRSHELLVRKQRLLPVLDEFIRQRQMLQSYGQFGPAK